MFRICTGMVVVVAVMVLCVSCADRNVETRAEQAAQAPPAAVHWVHSAALQDIMGDIEQRRLAVWPQEIAPEYEADAERANERGLRRARAFAHALAASTGQMPEALAGADLTEEQRAMFDSWVDDLQKQAQKIETAAAAEDIEATRVALANLTGTCNACHEQFREFAGPITVP